MSGSSFATLQQNGDQNNPFSLEVTRGAVRNLEVGSPPSGSIFANEGGELAINGLDVVNLDAASIVSSSNGAASIIRSVTVSSSDIEVRFSICMALHLLPTKFYSPFSIPCADFVFYYQPRSNDCCCN